MSNTRLQMLLERAPITEEDKYNISRIFSILSHERQIQILSDWDGYIARFIAIRNQMEIEATERMIMQLGHVSIILDEAIAREEERNKEKEAQKTRTREELESTVAYDQMRRLQKIKDISLST